MSECLEIDVKPERRLFSYESPSNRIASARHYTDFGGPVEPQRKTLSVFSVAS
jgi:hypothetical protein